MYWRQGIQLDMVSSVMSRDRLFDLRTCLHFVDTNNPPDNWEKNKLWKIQPVIDSVRRACRSISRDIDNYSVDEQMIPFTGRCTLRQYVKNKPRPVGLKNFVITTSKGLVVDFEVYQGSTTPFDDTSLGLGPSVVLHLCKTIPRMSTVYFDRYFTTLPLLDRLLEKQIYATGTIMANRLKDVNFPPGKATRRGDYHEYVRSDEKVVAIKWFDNNSVLAVSSACGSEPLSKVQRWSKKERKFVETDCPGMIRHYNMYMGGVDICDQQMEAYRTWVKTKKWTLKVSLHFLDLAVYNSWMEYRQDCANSDLQKKEIMDLLTFKMSLAESLLSKPKISRRRYSSSDDDLLEPREPPEKKPQNYRAPMPSVDKRVDSYGHWPVIDDLTTARMCRRALCKSRTRVRCEKCNIYLCLTKNQNCFKLFHTKA